jgi:putative ABC transport system ATP-binding protein
MRGTSVLIALDRIAKSYQTDDVETRALVDVSLAIERGEYISIEGPSGCGKSTLLSILGLLDTPTSGAYHLDGADAAQLPTAERSRIRNRSIGFIFQNFNLIGDLTVAENVELPLIYRGLSAAERRRRVAESLERVAMSHRARHFPAQLSGGQQQRVAVARALAGDPAVLLADEPTGNLDSTNGEAVMTLLSELHAAGSTIVMVTHDRRFNRYAPRTIGLLDGRVVPADVAAAM